MPLSPPVAREPIHHRAIECRGYRRSDGLWDIEGRITDTKTYEFTNRDRGAIRPGEAIHDMWIRITVDDGMLIHEVEAITDSSPFEICPMITSAFQSLKGVRLGPGWMKTVKERLGGVRGCTHLVELLGPVATTAFQTILPKMRPGEADRKKGEKPPLLNSCHAFRSDSELVRRFWPDHYTGT